MKSRESFVSNSSSSSFIIGLKRRPKSEEELKEQMFPSESNEELIQPYDDALKVSEVVHHVFLSLTNKYKDEGAQELKSEKKIIEEISGGCYEDYDDLYYKLKESKRPQDIISDEFKEKYGKSLWDIKVSDYDKEQLKFYKKYQKASGKHWEDQEKAILKGAKEFWRKEKAKFEGKKIFVVTYSDNDGSMGSILEHGNVFRHLPCITISKH